jgi:hypothetical protein
VIILKVLRQCGVAAVFVALAGCGGTSELLVPYSAIPPDDVDFSGTWKIREGESADQRSISRAIDTTDGQKQTVLVKPTGSSGGQSQSRSRQKRESGFVHVFLETGKLLKVTQTPGGFFVSVDRSVVEEFRFGEHRMVSVGEIEAQRVSGWQGDEYIVESLDKSGMKLTERFWVSEEGNLLNREITFRSKKNEERTLLQVFDRVDD